MRSSFCALHRGTVISTLTMVGYDCEIALQNDGKLVVAAKSAGVPVLMRFAADGTVDASYGEKGVVSLARR